MQLLGMLAPAIPMVPLHLQHSHMANPYRKPDHSSLESLDSAPYRDYGASRLGNEQNDRSSSFQPWEHYGRRGYRVLTTSPRDQFSRNSPIPVREPQSPRGFCLSPSSSQAALMGLRNLYLRFGSLSNTEVTRIGPSDPRCSGSLSALKCFSDFFKYGRNPL